MMNHLLRCSGVLLLLAGFALQGCAGSKPAEMATPATEINCICVLPVQLSSCEPVLNKSDQAAILSSAQEQIASALEEVIPPDIRLIRVLEYSDMIDCDVKLWSNIVFLQLVEQEDTAKAAAATVAGIALMAVTGIGFVSIPVAGMAMTLSLTDSMDNEIWRSAEQIQSGKIAIKQNYPKQAQGLLEMLSSKIKRNFPIRKEEG